MERRGAQAYRAKISFIFGDNTLYWTQHMSSCLGHLGAAFLSHFNVVIDYAGERVFFTNPSP